MTEIVVSDTSVLINFLKIDRLDLLGNCSLHFLVTDHVRSEITENFQDQFQRFQHGLENCILEEIHVRETPEIELFLALQQQGKLGMGECSAISIAVHRRYSLAIDDNVAIKSARAMAPHITILRTQDLMIKMIEEGVLKISDADAIRENWAIYHRFKMNIASFRSLIQETQYQK